MTVPGEKTVFVFVISLAMMWLTVIIHSLGAVYWLKFLATKLIRDEKMHQPLRLFRVIMMTTMILLLLHILQVYLYAFLFYALPGHAGLESFHQAFYFSVVTFTTLGYGDVVVDPQWQMIAGTEAMVGIVVFGLTAALLFAIIQKSWKVRREMHSEKSGFENN